MKKLACISLFVASLVACAGNPPDWWNPGNRYGSQTTLSTATQTATTPTVRSTKPMATEENLEPLPDNSYEEEVIAPLPEEDTLAMQSTIEPVSDNSLPMPSVLE